jgi:hypothetical protein
MKPESVKMHALSIEPNILKFSNGVYVGKTVDYTKLGVSEPCTKWMLGINVTEIVRVFRLKRKLSML